MPQIAASIKRGDKFHFSAHFRDSGKKVRPALPDGVSGKAGRAGSILPRLLQKPARQGQGVLQHRGFFSREKEERRSL